MLIADIKVFSLDSANKSVEQGGRGEWNNADKALDEIIKLLENLKKDLAESGNRLAQIDLRLFTSYASVKEISHGEVK